MLIGDVGWLREGSFIPLFNSLKPANHPVNGGNVPRDFLDMATRSQQKHTHLIISRTCPFNQGIMPRNPEGREPVLKQWHGADTGAFVVYEPPAVTDDIHSVGTVIKYMQENVDSWLEFANTTQQNRVVHDEDLVFVYGTIKVSRWAVAAFQGEQFRKAVGYVSGQLGQVGEGAFQVHGFPATHCVTGPICESSVPLDQCLFIRYYKMKRRTSGRSTRASIVALWNKLGAAVAASPHHLPTETRADTSGQGTTAIEEDLRSDSGSGYEHKLGLEDASRVKPVYDPISPLLDYILQYSKGHIAIASDEDIRVLFRGERIPDSDKLRKALRRLSPAVKVDIHSIGTVMVGRESAELPGKRALCRFLRRLFGYRSS
ncbi:hypothetical protein LXA43DRAFT_1091096 [Ganoderma leucocontextum]|nr:hypothetical protein LXA43DRAFT_1091096 [Ganoderma leucocontextum]